MFALFAPTTEIKRFKKGTLPKISIAVIVLLPLLYSALYLWAFWDPFNKTKDMPVAVVNLDKGTTVQGEKLDAGNQIIKELDKNRQLDWKFTDSKDAADGVTNGKYYFSITLAEDFSKSVASPLEMKPKKAAINVEFNNRNNYIASVMGKSAILELQKVISSSINTQTLDKLLVSIKAAGGGLQQAADGANQINDGANALLNGANELNSGLASASEGSKTLAEGIGSVKSGTQTLADSVNKVKADLENANGGKANLEKNLNTLESVFNQLVDSKITFQNLLNELNLNSSSNSNQTNKILSKYTNVDVQNLQGLKNNFALVKQEILKEDNNSDNSKLIEKLSSLVNGVNDLNNGVSKLQEGSNNLSSGLDQLYAGSGTLANGIGTLQNGTQTLSFKLSEGAKAIPDIPENKIKDIANTLGNPVESSLLFENEAKTFGYGFSPFFIPLALFVGGIITWLMIKPLQLNTLVTKMNPLRGVLTSFSPGMILQILQGTVIFLVVKFGLDFSPANSFATWGVIILIALCFASMIQMFNIIFGPSVGKVITMAFLMLQIVASGGIYPIETQPKLMEFLHKFDPMTYAVNSLRATVMGGFNNDNWKEILILIFITLGCLGISSLGAYRDRIWDMKRLHPPIQA